MNAKLKARIDRMNSQQFLKEHAKSDPLLQPTPRFAYVVRVRDAYCGVRGEYVEEIDVLREDEAKKWLKEWRSMYNREDGYSVTMKKEIR